MSRFRHLMALAGAASLIVAASLVPSAPAQASTDSQLFDTVGTFDFVVPAGVTQVTVDAFGAQGGNSNGGPPNPQGGLGGRTTATIAVTPGETLQVNVGGAGGNGASGSSAGGANGGGAGASSGGIGGGGGGASDVRRGGTALSDRVVVAGGGGGAGAFVLGGDGGSGGGDAPTPGGDGATFDFQGLGGGAGSDLAGGSGGAGQVTGGAGSEGQGGAGALGLDDGGGGGGGWFGGGGGGAGDAGGGGGGGGSGHAEETATDVSFENGVRSGNGSVELSWEVPAVTTTTSTTTTTTSTTTTSTTTTTTVAPPTTAPPTTTPPTTTPPAAGPSAGYSDGSGSLTVQAGGSIALRGDGWAADSSVEVTMYSDPVRLGAMTATATGAVAGTFSVPATTAIGAHRLELTGTSAAGGPATVVLELQVTAPLGSVTPAPTAPTQALSLTG